MKISVQQFYFLIQRKSNDDMPGEELYQDQYYVSFSWKDKFNALSSHLELGFPKVFKEILGWSLKRRHFLPTLPNLVNKNWGWD